MSEWVTAFAPASIGNVAVGFDMLGLALEGAGDREHTAPEAASQGAGEEASLRAPANLSGWPGMANCSRRSATAGFYLAVDALKQPPLALSGPPD